MHQTVSRAERTKRKLTMLGGSGAWRTPSGSPDTSGRVLRPADVAHAMSFIRHRHRDPETGQLSARGQFRSRLAELLLQVLYVDDGRPGPRMEALHRLMLARCEALAGVLPGDPDHVTVQRIVKRALFELTSPRLCCECRGNATVPEWRWQQLSHQVPDKTRQRNVECPKCGGSGTKPFSDRPRYEEIRTARRFQGPDDQPDCTYPALTKEAGGVPAS